MLRIQIQTALFLLVIVICSGISFAIGIFHYLIVIADYVLLFKHTLSNIDQRVNNEEDTSHDFYCLKSIKH